MKAAIVLIRRFQLNNSSNFKSYPLIASFLATASSRIYAKIFLFVQICVDSRIKKVEGFIFCNSLIT